MITNSDFVQHLLSNSDKHRRVQLPSELKGEICLETGVDLGDGTRVIYRPGKRHSSYIYSVSQRFPDEWFGCKFILAPLIAGLYGVTPRLRSSSPHRRGICVYLNSRAIVLFKHRVLGLPVGECSRRISVPAFVRDGGDGALGQFFEGYQYADGSFVGGLRPCIRVTTSSKVLCRDLKRTGEKLSLRFSITRDHPTFGFSMRIFEENSMNRWLQFVPLLNPIQIAKFLVWKGYSECPPRLYLAQYVQLLLGEVTPQSFARSRLTIPAQVRYLLDTVDLLTCYVLHRGPLTFAELARETVARSLGEARESVLRLVRARLAKLELGDQSYIALTEAGLDFLGRLREAWGIIRKENSRIAPLVL